MTVRTKKWLAFLSILLSSPFFFIGGPSYKGLRSLNSLWDLGHVLFFTLFTSLLYFFVSERKTRKDGFVEFIQIFFLVLLLGIFIELLQMLATSRYPDIFDIMRNQLGCLIAFAYMGYERIGWSAQKLRGFRVTVILLLFVALWPFGRDFLDEAIARYQFPLLSGFETPFEKGRWIDKRQLSLEKKIVRSGSKSLKVKLSTANYSGTSLYQFESDWRDYRWLHFSLYNPLGRQLTIHCRIHDVHHDEGGQPYADRFHRKFVLEKGWNDLKISLEDVRLAPASREMDMANIFRLGFFVVKQAKPMVIFLDEVYLSNK